MGLLSSNHFRLLIRLKEKENCVLDANWKRKMLDELMASWFSNRRSTESMKRGTSNESKAMECIKSLDFVLCCYDDGMFGDAESKWIAASPDEMGTIGTNKLDIEICKNDLYEDTEITENSNHYVNSKLSLNFVLQLTF